MTPDFQSRAQSSAKLPTVHHERSLGRSKLFGFTRGDLSVAPFILAAFGAAVVSAMGIMGWSYTGPKDFYTLISYTFLLLFFPAFLFAIVQRHWTSLPLWACFLAITWAGLSRPRRLMEPYHHRYYLFLFCIVFLTELARLIRGYKQSS